jgi:hypothetical protein
MPKLGFPNYLIVKKIKQNIAQVLPTKSWWLRHLDASMRSWVQTQAIHVHEFIYLVVYMMHIFVYVHVYIQCKEGIGGYLPTYHFIT